MVTEVAQTRKNAKRWQTVLANLGRYAGWWQVQIHSPSILHVDDFERVFTDDIDKLTADEPECVEPATPVRVVVCAANRYGDILILGARHFDALMARQLSQHHESGLIYRGTTCQGLDQGFIDQWGVYMTRKEALEVATAAGQIGRYRPKHAGEWLCSEDLY